MNRGRKPPMTSHRVFSGVIFFALLLLGLFQPMFAWIPPLIVLAAALLGIWEFSHFGAHHPPMLQVVLSILGGIAFVADGYFFSLQHGVIIIGTLTVLAVAAGLPMFEIDDIAAVAGKTVAAPTYVALPLGIILMIWRNHVDPSAAFPNAGAHYLLFLIILTWSSDTGAYFAGRQFGKTKIVPRLSPGKTLEGYIGGVALTYMLCIAAKLYWNNIDALFSWKDVIILATASSIIAPIGDLAESRLKRSARVKDSGRTFTGHGGMLDIIDSILFTTIFYYLYLALTRPEAFPWP